MGQLVLSRNPHQAVVLRDRDGHHIATVTYLSMRSGGQIRLGIEADRNAVTILRDELDRTDGHQETARP